MKRKLLLKFLVTIVIIFNCRFVFSQKKDYVIKDTALVNAMLAAGAPVAYGPQPEVGRPMPDFTLDNVTYYKKTTASLADFKGKWLIIDMWFKGCIVCIKNFPHINKLQQEFKDKIQFLLVGNNNRVNKGIKEVYEKIKEQENLNLVSAYDSTLIERFGVYSFPFVLIIDPNGIVRYIASGRDLTSSKLKQLINGEDPNFFPKYTDTYKGGLDNINPSESDTAILFRSELARFVKEDFFLQPIDYQLNLDIYKRKGFKVSGVALKYLYNLAYFGSHYWTQSDSLLYNTTFREPILEMKDTSLFVWSDRVVKGLYNYSLDVPPSKATKENLMRCLQNDLYGYFGFNAQIETRTMPVWKLVKTPNATVALRQSKTSGNMRLLNSDGTFIQGFDAYNMPIKTLMPLLSRYLKEMLFMPFFDETGITGPIDIKIFAKMSDILEVKRELQRNGLDIIRSDKAMKVLVISDSKTIKKTNQ